MKLAIQLVSYNMAKYVPYLIHSLYKQSYKDWHLFIWDNNSTDDSINMLQKYLEKYNIKYSLYENFDNLGFARGHNELFSQHTAEYTLLLNPDLYLESDCIEKLLNFLNNNHNISATAPRLMKWIPNLDIKANDIIFSPQKINNTFTDKIDALGLKLLRNRRVLEQHSQKSWNKIKHTFSTPHLSVFGISGTLALFRSNVLNDISIPNCNFFDHSYHSYKEDVDLAYRLQSAGHNVSVLLNSVAYHNRASGDSPISGLFNRHANKKRHSNYQNYHSYKNHILTLLKNEEILTFILDSPWIFSYEIQKILYYAIFSPSTLKSLWEISGNIKQTLQKRTEIDKKRKKKDFTPQS